MNVDFYIFEKVNQFAGKWPFLDNAAIFLADKFGYVLIIFLFLFLQKDRKYWLMIVQAMSSAILARLVIVNIIRLIWERPRPFIENNVNLLIFHDSSGSFPSGHAAFYFAIATVVYLYNKKIGILFFIGSLLIVLVRVFSGVHWPSDILAGAIVGIFSGWLVFKITKKFKKI